MTSTAKSIYQYLLEADGINQSQRFTAALDPLNLKIDDRSLSDLIRFVSDISSQVIYYDKDKQPQGDWRPFFDVFRKGNTLLSEAELRAMLLQRKDITPHVALLLAFLKIFTYAQNDLNAITGKRLNYYYEEILKIQRAIAAPDQVHVLFELSKNAKPVLLKRGTLLDGGKTSKGLPLHYALDGDTLVNHATIGSIRTSFVDVTKTGKGVFFKTDDAKKVLNDTKTAWRPFGATQLSIGSELQTMQAVHFGWSVASPNFLLAEGHRVVKLSFIVKSFKGTKFAGAVLSSMFDITITGEKDWFKPDQILKAELLPAIPIELQDDTIENSFELNVWVAFHEASPAVTSYDEAIHKQSFPTSWPILRVLVRPESYMIEVLSRFRVEQVIIEVEVTGVRNLILQNDQAVQPSDKPILPFGSTPFIGSSFYIGSEEVFSKSLTSLSVKWQWQDAPEDLTAYYDGYGNAEIGIQAFTLRADLLSAKNWNTNLNPNKSLFNSQGTQLEQSMQVSKSTFALATANLPFRRNPELQLPSSYNASQNQGFVRLTLSGPTRDDVGNLPTVAPFEAFGHKSYPSVYTQQAIALSNFSGSGTPPTLPKAPYTPVLKSVSLDYTSKDVLVLSAPNDIDQYFVQDIFGVLPIGKNDVATLLPSHTGKGALYIGLEKANVPQSVSFLFEVEEGSVPGETLLQSEEIEWSYLAGNVWRPIVSSDIIEERTNGIQKPGLIKLNVGHDASIDHTRMPKGQHWIRASVSNPEGAAAVSDIMINAARAALSIPPTLANDYEEHLSNLLDVGKISKLIIKNPSIKKITQPYRSFGGRASETNQAFYRRVSERLRHKNRAVSSWDYERLLLQNYPEIYKLKCLSHADKSNEIKPGDVWLVVVPDWRKRPMGDPLQPKANRSLLKDIGSFIQSQFTSPFVNVHVTNPTYETILVDCKVSFHEGFDPGYFSTVLEEEIKRFLSPWAYSEGQDIVFGGKIHASEILAFIEGREYVDFILDFELYHRHPDYSAYGISDMEVDFDFVVGYSPEPSISVSGSETGGKTIGIDFIVGQPVEVAAATRPDSILVSNSSHRIQAVQAGVNSCQGVHAIGIGQMIVGLDFIPIS